MFVLTRKTVGVEVRTMPQGVGDLGTKGVHTEIITPDLAMPGVRENLGFERRFMIYT